MPTTPAEDLIPLDVSDLPDMVNTDGSGAPIATPYPELDRTRFRDASVWNAIKNAVVEGRDSLIDVGERVKTLEEAPPPPSGEKARASMSASAPQTVATGFGSPTQIELDTVDYAHGGASQPSCDVVNHRIFIAKAGTYRVTLRAFYQAPVAPGMVGVIVWKNGSLANLFSADFRYLAIEGGSVCATIEHDFAINDYIEAAYAQDTGSDIDSDIGTPPYNGHVLTRLQVSEV